MPNHDLPTGHLDKCQICGKKNLELVFDLGHHPPCDSLLTREQLSTMEMTYPLRLVRCLDCGLAQIDYVVAPEVLFFSDYPYRSGITAVLANNLQGTAKKLCAALQLQSGSLAIDIGSNDGTILQGFKSCGLKVLGIEPTNVAKIAIANGIPTVQSFFSEEVAKEILQEHGKAAVITAANMFAHVAKLGELIRGVEALLDEGGMFVTESHYLLDLIQTMQYDSIYHEHLKYYSIKSLLALFEYYNFTLVDVERIPNYGGSIRAYAQKGKAHKVSERVHNLLREEDRFKLMEPEPYARMKEQVLGAKLDLQVLLLDLRRQGKSVVGIGCPGRASTLLNYCKIDPDLMPYIAEQSTSLKLGLFMPGCHIPVVDEAVMFKENPDYAVMLSWHYAQPIIKKLRQKGLKAKIILPLPEVRLQED